jgi:hypothetical protein
MRNYFYQIRLGEAKREKGWLGKKAGLRRRASLTRVDRDLAKKAWVYFLGTDGLEQYLFWEEIFISCGAEVYQN